MNFCFGEKIIEKKDEGEREKKQTACEQFRFDSSVHNISIHIVSIIAQTAFGLRLWNIIGWLLPLFLTSLSRRKQRYSIPTDYYFYLFLRFFRSVSRLLFLIDNAVWFTSIIHWRDDSFRTSSLRESVFNWFFFSFLLLNWIGLLFLHCSRITANSICRIFNNDDDGLTVWRWPMCRV